MVLLSSFKSSKTAFMRVIFLTVAISALAALLFPVKDEEVSA